MQLCVNAVGDSTSLCTNMVEYADRASGAKDSRPALDALLKAGRRREFDVVVVWRRL